jgi:hypothetical protein
MTALLILGYVTLLLLACPVIIFEMKFGTMPFQLSWSRPKRRITIRRNENAQSKINRRLTELAMARKIQNTLLDNDLATLADVQRVNRKYQAAKNIAELWGFRTHRKFEGYLADPGPIAAMMKALEAHGLKL